MRYYVCMTGPTADTARFVTLHTKYGVRALVFTDPVKLRWYMDLLESVSTKPLYDAGIEVESRGDIVRILTANEIPESWIIFEGDPDFKELLTSLRRQYA
jgi:hypothetical protein